MQSKVDNAKYVTNVVKEGEGIKITWNDGTTSTIQTIKGDKGEAGQNGTNGKDGKNGTIVTIIDGFWAFDGVKSDVPAKGEKGDKGDQGEKGEAGAQGEKGEAGKDGVDGKDAHEIKISPAGYWMVWDAEKGEYVTTDYIAGGASAVETEGGWNIMVKDNNGETQTIFVPTSAAMGNIVVPTEFNENDGKKLNEAEALYGIVKKDVKYGPKEQFTLAKGVWATLDRDLLVVVNPQDADASLYDFDLKTSKNQSSQLKFKSVKPFEGLLSRTISSNGLWILENGFTYYEDIVKARTENYLLFKTNDAANRHALALSAKMGDKVINSPYDVAASVKEIKTLPTLQFEGLDYAAINKDYAPVIDAKKSVNESAVYDYWLTLEQSATNLKQALQYGVEIAEDGRTFKYTKEAGINNEIKFVYHFVTIYGATSTAAYNVTLGQEMAVEHTQTLERLETPFDAKQVGTSEVFTMTTKAYSLSALLEQMNDLDKAVFNEAKEANSYEATLIGGDDENDPNSNAKLLADNAVKFEISKSDAKVKNYDQITFTFKAEAGKANFVLGKAYQLTVAVKDKTTKNVVATIVLPFELSQPTLDITRVNGEKAIWNAAKNVLSVYGDKVGSNMNLPLYEAFSTAYEAKTNGTPNYNKQKFTAKYYDFDAKIFRNATVAKPGENENIQSTTLAGNTFVSLPADPEVNAGRAVWDLNNTDPSIVDLTNIVYSEIAANWNTFTTSLGVNNKFWDIYVEPTYKFYGVYEATKDQVSTFKLRFASLLGDAKKVEATPQTVSNVQRYVVMTDEDFNLVDALDHKFYLFDGINSTTGNVINRYNMNFATFEEGVEGFATDFAIATAGVSTTSVKVLNADTKKVIPGITVDVHAFAEGKAWLVPTANGLDREWTPDTSIVPTDNKVRVFLFNAIPAEPATATTPILPGKSGGMMIQMHKNLGTTETVILQFTLTDVFGTTKTIDVPVKAAF